MATGTAITRAGTGTGTSTRAAGLRARALAASLALFLAVAVPVADQGGFSTGGRTLLIAFAALALSAVMSADEEAVFVLGRAPVVLALVGLAALSAVSSAWTIGEPAAAVRWGMVLAGLAALVVVAAHTARSANGLMVLVAFLAGLAGIEALLGLVYAGLRIEPLAERIEGTWRPGGTFEYPPALALLQISAMPALVWGMVRGRLRLAAPAAIGGALAGATVALAASRTETALALAVIGAGLALAPRALGVPRRAMALAGLLPVGAGLGAHMVAGGYAFPGATGGDTERLIGLAVVILASAGTWVVVRSRLWRVVLRPARRWPRSRRRAAAVAVACVTVGLLAAQAVGSDSSHPWVEPASGFTHGRSTEWRAAAETALDHPVAGAGADAYLAASARHQGRGVSLYAHNLPLEAWAELGPAGLALVLCLYGFTGLLIWRIRRLPAAWLVAPGAAVFLLANLVDWPWHLAGSAAVWAVCLGACVALRRQASGAAPRPRAGV